MSNILNVAHRLNEKVWFQAFQPLLVRMANTKEGRDLLCIDQSLPIIDRLGTSFVRSPIGGKRFLSEFRSSPKYGRVIRHRWPEFQKAAKRFYELEQNRMPATMLWTPEFMFAAHATDTFYPDTGSGNTSVDGYAGLNGVSMTWSQIRGAEGLSANTDNSFITLTQIRHASSSFTDLFRGFVHFNTSPLGGDEILSGVVSAYGQAKANPTFSLDTAVFASNAASDNNIVATDKNKVGTTAFSNVITFANFTLEEYNDYTLNATGLTAINGEGVTKFSIYNKQYDADNSTPPTNSGTWTHNVRAYAADETGTAKDPKLVVEHEAAAASGDIFFGFNF